MLFSLCMGGSTLVSIPQKRPDQGRASVHGEPKFIEGQQPYVQQLRGLDPAKKHHWPGCCGLWLENAGSGPVTGFWQRSHPDSDSGLILVSVQSPEALE